MICAHKKSVARRFGAAAETYGSYAHVQAGAAARLLDELAAGPAPRRILEAGCGTGILTEGLLERFPEAVVDAVDIAPEMTAHTARRLGAVDRLRLITGDVEQFAPDASYDWIVSSSALHWLPSRGPVFKRFHQLLNPGGRLGFSLMLRGTFMELQAARREAVPQKEPPIRLPEFAEVQEEVRAAGFRIERAMESAETVHYDSVRDFFRRISRQGVTGGGAHTERLSRGELRRLEEVYRLRFGTAAGRIPATYAIGQVSALREAL